MTTDLHAFEAKRQARASIREKSTQLLDVIRRTDSDGRQTEPEEGER